MDDHLNLPKRIIFDEGNDHGSDQIRYTYDTNGTKLSKEVITYTGTNGRTHAITHYENSFITRENKNYSYTETTENDATDNEASGYWIGNEVDLGIQFISQPEGYIEIDNQGGFDYVFQHKDHLGNIRLSYKDSNKDGSVDSSEIIEENNYYPFGLEHKGYNNVVNGQEFTYKEFQGQEVTKDFDLNIHEWKYRVSNPAIGRFWQFDPLAEYYVYNGVYNFSENRVIDGFELEGLEWVDTDEGWQYQGYNFGPRPVPENAIGIAPEGSRPVASWVSQEPRGVPFTGTVETLNVGGPDGTVQQFAANSSGMVELPHTGTEQTGARTSGTYAIDGHTVYGYYNRNDVAGAVDDQWGTPTNVSNMINAITEFDIQTLLDNTIQIGDMKSPTNGRPNINATESHHGNNGAFDIRLLGDNGGLPGGTTINNNNFSTQNSQLFINALGNNGFSRFLIGPNAVPNLNNSGTINARDGGDVHNNHYHIDVD